MPRMRGRSGCFSGLEASTADCRTTQRERRVAEYSNPRATLEKCCMTCAIIYRKPTRPPEAYPYRPRATEGLQFSVKESGHVSTQTVLVHASRDACWLHDGGHAECTDPRIRSAD